MNINKYYYIYKFNRCEGKMKEIIRNATIEDFNRGYLWDNKKGEFI